MNNQDDIRIECLSEIFLQVGITATEEQINVVSKDYALHLEMEREIASYSHSGGNIVCNKCESLKLELDETKEALQIHINSVKKRRGASRVWIEQQSIMYEK